MLDYAAMLFAVIRASRSRADFVTKMFARNASLLLDTDPSAEMKASNIRYFDQAPDHELAEAVAADLPTREACVYRWLAGGIAGSPRTQKPPTAGRRSVCERVSLFCNPSESPRLDPSLATCDEEGPQMRRSCKTAPLNTCCLYYGHGWLRDDDAFRRLRARVANARVECAHSPFPLASFPPDSSPVWRTADAHWNVSQPLGALLPQPIDRGGDVVLYTSNIGNWVSDSWSGLLQSWAQEAAGYGVHLYPAGRKIGWGSAGWYAYKLV